MPPKVGAQAAPLVQVPICDRRFDLLQPHLYAACATAQHMCRTCTHPVHLHAMAAPPVAQHVPGAAVVPVAHGVVGAPPPPGAPAVDGAVAGPAAVEAVLGPPLVPPADRAQVFIRVIDAWCLGPFCSDETDAAKAALHYLQACMFNGSTDFIGNTFRAFGELDLSRTFALRGDVDDGVNARRCRGRDIMSMAELAMKAVIPIARAIARHRHFVLHRPLPVQRSRSGVSSEIAFLDDLVARKVVLQPFQMIPPPDTWTTCDGPIWWGLWIASAPPEFLREAFERLVVRAGERFRASHSDAFTDRVTWEDRYRDETAARKRSRSIGGDSGSEYLRKTRRTFVPRVIEGVGGAVQSSAPAALPHVPPHSGGASAGGRGRGAVNGRGGRWINTHRGRGGRGGRGAV